VTAALKNASKITVLTYLRAYRCLGTDFKTPKLHRTVRASDLAYQSRGDYQTDYLTVEHNTVVDLRDEFILLGRETDNGKVIVYFPKHKNRMSQVYRSAFSPWGSAPRTGSRSVQPFLHIAAA